jgi:hypothetical protein
MFDELEADMRAEEAFYAEALKQHQADVEAWQVEMAEARKQYPSACANCGGSGVSYHSYDPSPAGVALSAGSFTEADLCPACTGEHLCPRCGEHGIDHDEDVMVCEHCGWTEEDTTEVLPRQPEF